MDINAALSSNQPEPPRRHEPRFEYEWDGGKGFIQTGPLTERPRTWDAFIRDAGLDPDEVEVLEPVNVRGWDAQAGAGSVVRMHYYRLNVQRRGTHRDAADFAALVKAAMAGARKRPGAPAGDVGFVLALGDLQLGKADGDGVEGTVARFIEKTTAARDRYLRLNKGATTRMPVLIAHLGDCIEGFVSQGGANAWRTTLTTTEQVALYRHLLLEQVKTFAAVAPSLIVCGVPGNHDEAHRPLHTYGDSWAIDALAAVRQACELAGRFDHVTFYAPARDELCLALDFCGTGIALAHGHQFGSGVEGWKKWWQGQQFGRQTVGDCDLLLAGHKHHLVVNQTAGRTFIQTPALESESTWWRHRTGEGGNPGVVTILVGAGGWSGMEIL